MQTGPEAAPVTRAEAILQALNERAPPLPPLERTTGMPYGWAMWLRALSPLPAAPHARPDEVVSVLGQRPPAPVAPGTELAPWAAFLSLFHQGWLPPPRDERPVRWVSWAGTAVLHVLFVVLLAWMAYLQSLLPPPPPPESGGGERVAVGFVGAGDPGTPRSEAAEAPSSTPGEPAPARTAATTTAAAAMQADAGTGADEGVVAPPTPVVEVPTEVPSPALARPLPEVAVREVPQPASPAPQVEQPVQVTEVEQPTIDYVLPPTTPREVTVPPVAQPQLREREVVVVQAPAIRAPQARALDVPVPQAREAQMRTREVDEPLPQVAVRPAAVAVPEVEATVRRARESSVRQREVAMPSPPAPTPTPSPAPASTPSSAPSPAAPGAAQTTTRATATPAGATGTPAPSTARAPGANAATPAARPATGSGWESPRTGDDWGQARSGQARPGGSPGLFDGEGRVRLPGAGEGATTGNTAGEGVAERGAPGGDSDAWTRDRIDQSGTWLKRPPYDYDPTSLDRYWVPNDSLLAEWVRKGMKSVAIPIPGTGKNISCVISILQLGGGCGITDPNINLRPSDGRPPPDVPFKPELQEDNGSVRP